jgi:CHASE2 domain-containing sensor protein
MNHVNPGATHKATSRFRAVAEHWLVAIMLGMVIGLLQAVFEPLAPLRVLEHIGGDMAMARVANQLEGRNWPAAPKLVLVRIDESAMRQWNATLGAQARGEIGRLVDRIRHAGASAVVLDITFDAPISGRDSATADNKLLRAVLASSDGAPLILAAPLVDKRIDGGASAGRSRSNAMLLRLEPYPDRLVLQPGLRVIPSGR